MNDRALVRPDAASLPVRKEFPVIRVDTQSVPLMDLCQALAGSGYFKDARDASQAVVKVLFGQELGFPPVTSMMGIHIIEGKPAPSSNLLAAAVKRSGIYAYRVLENSDTRCELAWFERGQEIGRSVWTIQDATRAGLAGKNTWKNYPRQMLFSRALSEGVRVYCPDLFGGAPVYTPEELGAEVEPGGEVIRLPSGQSVRSTTGEVFEPRSPAAERVAASLETAGTYAGSAGLKPDPNGVMVRVREAWGRSFEAGDKDGLKDYILRVLGRQSTPAKEDAAGFCADMEAVISDLNSAGTARKRCFAVYTRTQGDPDAQEGAKMRQEMSRILGREVKHRSTLTAQEMDQCTAAWETPEDIFEEE